MDFMITTLKFIKLCHYFGINKYDLKSLEASAISLYTALYKYHFHKNTFFHHADIYTGLIKSQTSMTIKQLALTLKGHVAMRLYQEAKLDIEQWFTPGTKTYFLVADR